MANEDKTFNRQLPLLEEVQNVQQQCSHDSIVQVNQYTLACRQCGAMWIK